MDDLLYPPAFCPVHGLFPARGLAFPKEKATQIRVSNCEINCPTCNRLCEILPGEYSRDIDHLNLLVDPSITPEALSAIIRLAEKARAGEISVEEAKAEAEKISPNAGRLFDIADWSDTAKATFFGAVILAAAGVIGSLGAAAISTFGSRPTSVVEEPVRTIKSKLKDSTAGPANPLPKTKSQRK